MVLIQFATRFQFSCVTTKSLKDRKIHLSLISMLSLAAHGDAKTCLCFSREKMTVADAVIASSIFADVLLSATI